MNIQIFGTKKCFDTKKAERYFKERNIKYQLTDLKEKGMSKGEYTSVKQAVGGLDAMLNADCKDKDALALIRYIAAEDRDEKVLENQKVLRTPIVRNAKRPQSDTSLRYGKHGIKSGCINHNHCPEPWIQEQKRGIYPMDILRVAVCDDGQMCYTP